MTDEDLIRIKILFESLIKPVRDEVKDQLHLIHPRIDMIGSRQEISNDKLDNLVGKVDALSGDMEQVLSEVKATHDEIGLWHQRDKREIDEIKKHLNLSIIPARPEI
jgi:hypothetical protein